jgi:hypothetical protein
MVHMDVMSESHKSLTFYLDNERNAIDEDLKKRKRRAGCFQESGPNTWTMMSHDVFDPKRNKMFDATEWIGMCIFL